MAIVTSPAAVAATSGLEVIAVQVDMRNAAVAVDRLDAALAGLLMSDVGSVFAYYVAFSVRAENAKDSQMRGLYEQIAARHLQRFNELLQNRKVDHIFKQPVEQLRKKFLAVYPLGRS